MIGVAGVIAWMLVLQAFQAPSDASTPPASAPPQSSGTTLPACYQGEDLWIMSLCGSRSDMPITMAVTSNGTLMVAGATYSQDGSFADAPAISADQANSFIATMTRPTDMSMRFDGIQFNDTAPLADGGFIAAGDVIVGDIPVGGGYYASDVDAIVTRYDQNLNVVWQTTYGTKTSLDSFHNVAVGPDGTIVALDLTDEATSDPTVNNTHVILVKFSDTGDQLWAHDYGDMHKDFLGTPVVVDANGNIYVMVTSDKPNPDDPDSTLAGATVAMFDPKGKLVWTKEYGGTGMESFDDAVPTAGGIMVVGWSGSVDGDFASPTGSAAVMAEINKKGNIVASCTYDAVDGAEFYAAATTGNGEYAVAGQSYLNGSGNEALAALVRPPTGLHEACDVNWYRTFGGTDDEYFSDIAVAPDGGLFVMGETNSTDGTLPASMGDADGVIVKLTLQGDIGTP